MHADGSPARAAMIMAEGQRRAAEDDAVSSEAWILHERLRMGEREGIAARLAELPGVGPLAQARIALARGIEDRDRGRLPSRETCSATWGQPCSQPRRSRWRRVSVVGVTRSLLAGELMPCWARSDVRRRRCCAGWSSTR
ncbi:hypothetical protein [Aeromicrobium sp. UC242_57]|uniref:hypothetical protein n=1 Tax=Aeromicrobium sp. UC242_57 TaxID=3374624 RepID=UPI0037AE0A7B